MNPALNERLRQRLSAIGEAGQYRSRRVVEGAHAVRMTVDGRQVTNFCSNDYLGLAADPRVAEAAGAALRRSGTGSGASALVSGYNAEHRALEEALAAWLGRERVLLFSSGWAVNVGVIRALLGRDDQLVADELNHASLIDGGRLSGARYCRVPHRDLGAIDAALSEDTSGLRLVVSDAVFSMDGDVADIGGLSALCRRHDASLMIDDAHGLGVLGAGGRGAIEWAASVPGADPALRVDVQVATMGKSLGAAGAFVAGDAPLIEYLIQRARSWVFSTAPPPAIAAAARRALQLIIDEPAHRLRLLDNIAYFRAGARQRQLPIGVPGISRDDDPPTPIQIVMVGPEAPALALSRTLLERGFWVAAIRPPTVPPASSRLRITLSAAHQRGQIDALLDALADAWQLLQASLAADATPAAR